MSKDNLVQTGLRLPKEFVDRADRLTETITAQEVGSSSRADVLRAAVALGLDELEKRYSNEGKGKK